MERLGPREISRSHPDGRDGVRSYCPAGSTVMWPSMPVWMRHQYV